MQKDELDQLLQRLQLENLELKKELEKRRTAAMSTPDLDRFVACTLNFALYRCTLLFVV